MRMMYHMLAWASPPASSPKIHGPPTRSHTSWEIEKAQAAAAADPATHIPPDMMVDAATTRGAVWLRGKVAGSLVAHSARLRSGASGI